MASFLSKFARGSAATGGALYADMAREQLRSDIMAKRDGVLNDNRIVLEKSRQEAQTTMHKERMAQQESQFTRGLESPQNKAAGIKLVSAKKLETLKSDYAAAKTDEERSSIAKLMAAEQGKPVETSGAKGTGPTAATKEARILATLDEFKNEAEALRFLKSKEGNMTREIFKAILAKQEDSLMSTDDPDYLSFEDALTKAREMAKPDKTAKTDSLEPIDGEYPNTTKHPSIKSEDSFDNLKSGDVYFDVFDGKLYRKP